jgi:hypothetical protein
MLAVSARASASRRAAVLVTSDPNKPVMTALPGVPRKSRSSGFRRRRRSCGSLPAANVKAYFKAVWIDVNVVFKLDPRLATTVMIATEMPAAISPYSMAVAAFSSWAKRISSVFM